MDQEAKPTKRQFDYHAFIDELKGSRESLKTIARTGHMDVDDPLFRQWVIHLNRLTEKVAGIGYKIPIRLRNRHFGTSGIDAQTRSDDLERCVRETTAEIDIALYDYETYGEPQPNNLLVNPSAAIAEVLPAPLTPPKPEKLDDWWDVVERSTWKLRSYVMASVGTLAFGAFSGGMYVGGTPLGQDVITKVTPAPKTVVAPPAVPPASKP